MTATEIAAADPEVAAATLLAHLDELWASGKPDRLGWKRFQLDPLRWIIVMPAATANGDSTHFFLRLDGRCYDLWPADVQFVDPDNWEPVGSGQWWPNVQPPPNSWWALHSSYAFSDGPRPLICFSHTLGYYESNHTPTPDIRWSQGTHTVAATINRIAEILSPAHFLGPSA